MRIPICCSQCLRQFGIDATAVELYEFVDDQRYAVTCSRGHSFVTLLQNHRFELLFDVGANAIVDGYYREAVSSFTSSLERFYEFFLGVVMREKRLDEKVLVQAWKHVAKQSERQYGAFIFLYTVEFMEVPKLMSQKRIEFRNKVIHQGKLPTREEALEYGDEVLNLIRPLLQLLKAKYSEGKIQSIIQQGLRNRRPEDGNVQSAVVPTILSVTREDSDADSLMLKEAIETLWHPL